MFLPAAKPFSPFFLGSLPYPPVGPNPLSTPATRFSVGTETLINLIRLDSIRLGRLSSASCQSHPIPIARSSAAKYCYNRRQHPFPEKVIHRFSTDRTVAIRHCLRTRFSRYSRARYCEKFNMAGRRQYPFHLIEPKWQQFWDRQQTFRAWNPGETLPAGHPFAQRHGLEGKTVRAEQLPPKFYILDMFPYPSGAGLHVGHPEGYTATDILARYRRAQGRHVLHPMGWDAFGLPAEQYAIKTGQHPRKTTEANIATFKRQIKSLGFSYDWSREVDTTDPNYFKWTQWIFLKLYNSYFDTEWNKAAPISFIEDALSDTPKLKTFWEKNALLQGIHSHWLKRKNNSTEKDLVKKRREQIDRWRLAYVTEAPVWWCEGLGTVLANEEVVDGKSEVGGFPVVRKPMRQWMFRITAYAERLLSDLDIIDWTSSLKEMQRNWIGRSEGAIVDFEVADSQRRRFACSRPVQTLCSALPTWCLRRNTGS